MTPPMSPLRVGGDEMRPAMPVVSWLTAFLKPQHVVNMRLTAPRIKMAESICGVRIYLAGAHKGAPREAGG